MDKRLKLLLVSLAAIFVGFILAWFKIFGVVQTPQSFKLNTIDVSSTPTPQMENNATLKIDYGEENISSYSYDFSGDKTAYDSLKETLDKNQIPMEITNYDFGIFVKSINGNESTAEMAWIYFINGVSGNVAADQTKIKSGDIIEWRYIKPE